MMSENSKNLIDEYTQLILDNLPEWNYTGADRNPYIQKQKSDFARNIATIDTNLPKNQTLLNLANIIDIHVPDNHIDILDENNQSLTNRKREKSENFNLATKNNEELKRLGLFDIKRIEIQENSPPWIIASYKDTGIVAIPSFTIDDDYEEHQNKCSRFIEELLKEKENKGWTNLIFDFRGNAGGDAAVIKEIGEKISGKEIKYADKMEVIRYKGDEQTHKEIYAQKEHTENYSTSELKSKFSGNICILQDSSNASAAEGAIFMLSQLGRVRTVGENTVGAFAGGSCVSLPMSYGKLVIGTEYRERNLNGVRVEEKKGLIPSLWTQSENALNKALEYLDKANNANLNNSIILKHFKMR